MNFNKINAIISVIKKDVVLCKNIAFNFCLLSYKISCPVGFLISLRKLWDFFSTVNSQ